MNYVILAAGQGSRFTKEGETNPKPMVNILGRPMIERLIDILMKCDAERIYIATNANMPSLNKHLLSLRDKTGLPLDIRPIISDNSFYSLVQACNGINGKFIAMTVDAIFPTDEFKEYVKCFEQTEDNIALMGLTKFVDDESPLYAKLSPDGDEIINYRYGGEPFDSTIIVSAGMYGLTDSMIKISQQNTYPESLSDFQRILAIGDQITARPYVFSKAFDVDCGHDRIEAEHFVATVNKETPYE